MLAEPVAQPGDARVAARVCVCPGSGADASGANMSVTGSKQGGGAGGACTSMMVGGGAGAGTCTSMMVGGGGGYFSCTTMVTGSGGVTGGASQIEAETTASVAPMAASKATSKAGAPSPANGRAGGKASGSSAFTETLSILPARRAGLAGLRHLEQRRHQVDAAIEVGAPIDEFLDHRFAAEQRAVLRGDDFDVQRAHHVGPERSWRDLLVM